jgi:hypothetical protein
MGEGFAMTLALKPKRGGFLRPLPCGIFLREFLLGNGPYGSPKIDPDIGAPQADMFREYKLALMRATALDKATRVEEKQARKGRRPINPDNIEKLEKYLLDRMPYKAKGMRSHSFNTYFSNIKKLGWVEATGKEEPSSFQEHYPEGQPRRYFRLTRAGRQASEADWSNPYKTLYGKG